MQRPHPNDAAGICEAVERPRMRSVPVKSVPQQDMQALHRIRERQIKARTALLNQIRGLLAEYGIVIPSVRLRSGTNCPTFSKTPRMV